jgi:hypothetical protein
MSQDETPHDPYAVEVEDASPDRDISELHDYIEANELTWTLDPDFFMISQPVDQEELIVDAMVELITLEGGDSLVSHLTANLNLLRRMQGFPDSRVTAALHIVVANKVTPADLRGLTPEEQQRKRLGGSSHEECIDDPSLQNAMIAQLLAITGAQVMREEQRGMTGSGKKLYKGVLEDKPVYFLEDVKDRLISPLPGSKPILERSFRALAGQAAREDLDELSREDRKAMATAGISMIPFNLLQERSLQRCGRGRLGEVLRLYELYQLPYDGPEL